jgi:hypothetical protein
MNHDVLFKSLLRTGRLLRDFFEVFLPRTHRFIDFDHIEFVDKERFTLEGKRRTGDLLIKTKPTWPAGSNLIRNNQAA